MNTYLGNITPEAAVLHNITVMRQRVANSRLSIAQKSVHLNLIDQVLAKWNTPERMLYIQKAAEAERIYEAQGLMGFAGVDAIEGLSGFWSKVKSFASKVGSGVVSAAKMALPIAAGLVPGGSIISSLMNRGGGGQPQQQAEPPQAAAPQAAPQQQYVAPRRQAPAIQRQYAAPRQQAAPQQQYAAIEPQYSEPQQEEPKKWYQKTPAKIGMGVGGVFVLGTVIYLVTRPKNQPQNYAPVNNFQTY